MFILFPPFMSTSARVVSQLASTAHGSTANWPCMVQHTDPYRVTPSLRRAFGAVKPASGDADINIS
jgi:hypothetical protein